MKFKLFASLLFGALFLSACVPATGTVEEPDSAPAEETGGVMEEEDVSLEQPGEELAAMATYMDFDQEAYEAALADGKTVFLDFYASWCPTCLGNAPEIEAAFKNTDKELVGFRVDYDNSAALQKEFGVITQSTYILIPAGDTDDFRVKVGSVDEEDVLEFFES